MKRSIILIMATVLVLAFTAPAMAGYTSDSFRCQQQNLVTRGASIYEVRHLCGAPDMIEVLGKQSADALWIYDLGHTDFIYYLEFSRGRLERIEHRGERGFK